MQLDGKSFALKGKNFFLILDFRFLYSPINSFFLQSTDITGSPEARNSFNKVFDMFKLSVPVGMISAFSGLFIGLKTVTHIYHDFAYCFMADLTTLLLQ